MRELLGAPVVAAVVEKLRPIREELAQVGVTPKLAAVLVGDGEDDLAYANSIKKRFDAENALFDIKKLPGACGQDELEKTLSELNADPAIHGILLFRPLPKGLDDDRARALISAYKDVDCMGDSNRAALFAGGKDFFPPCTAQAVIELLEHYGVPLAGKRVAVVGRSMVVGKPLAMLLLAKNATVTVCHTKTADLAAECRSADIIAACAGVAGLITKDHVSPGQIVVDVGINVGSDGRLCGDVVYSDMLDIVEACSPVPRGVGGVTSAVLYKNTVLAAAKAAKIG